MNSLVVLVAFVAGLVQAAPSHWAGVPLGHSGAYSHAGAYSHGGYDHTTGHGVWNGPINIPVVLPSGHLADTHDVATLKQAHAVAVAHTPGVHDHAYGHGAYGHGAYGHDSYGHSAYGHGAYGHGAYGHGAYGHGAYAHSPAHGAWHGPINIPVVLPSGHLADTPEVAHLKSAHVARLHGAHL